MQLSALYRHPVKSCAALSCTHLEVQAHGPADDRRWMVVDAQGKFLTGRQHGRLTQVQAIPEDDGLRLSAPGRRALFVAIPATTSPRRAVSVWRDQVDAACAGKAADAWFSDLLGQTVHLVHFDARSHRPVDSGYGQPGDEVGFADGFPYLLVSEASLDGLNARLARPVSMRHFRPNLVVTGAAPHDEDRWRRIRIGTVTLDVVKPCTRCVFITVDPDTGERDPDGEPLRTLLAYRRFDQGIRFGQNLIARGNGTLHVGDPVQVLA